MRSIAGIVVMAVMCGHAFGPAAVAGPQQAAAGGAGRKAGRSLQGEDRVLHMSRMLGLSSAQEGRLRPIMQEYEHRMQGMEADASLSHRAKSDRKRSLRESKDARIREILTPEQRQRFERSRMIREKMGIE